MRSCPPSSSTTPLRFLPPSPSLVNKPCQEKKEATTDQKKEIGLSLPLLLLHYSFSKLPQQRPRRRQQNISLSPLLTPLLCTSPPLPFLRHFHSALTAHSSIAVPKGEEGKGGAGKRVGREEGLCSSSSSRFLPFLIKDFCKTFLFSEKKD